MTVAAPAGFGIEQRATDRQKDLHCDPDRHRQQGGTRQQRRGGGTDGGRATEQGRRPVGREKDRRGGDGQPREDADIEEPRIRAVKDAIDQENRQPGAVPHQQRRAHDMQRDDPPCGGDHHPVGFKQRRDPEPLDPVAQPQPQRFAPQPVRRQLDQPGIDQHDLGLDAQDRDGGGRHMRIARLPPRIQRPDAGRRQTAQQGRIKQHQIEVVQIFRRIQQEEITEQHRQRDDRHAIEQPQHDQRRRQPHAQPCDLQPWLRQRLDPAETGIGEMELGLNPVTPDPLVFDETPAVPQHQRPEGDPEQRQRLGADGR